MQRRTLISWVIIVVILSEIAPIICVQNMTLLNHRLSSLTNVGGLTDTEEGLTGFSATAYLESGSGDAGALSLDAGETFFGVGRTPSDLSVRKYLKYVDHNSCLTSWNLYIEPNGEIWMHLKKPGIDTQYNTGCSLAPNSIFAWRLDHNDSSDSDNNYRMHLYMYTNGDSCDGTLMHYEGNPTSSSDCSGDPITVRFFYNWTGGTVYEMTHNGDRDSTNPDCCHDGNLDYYPGYPIHNAAFLFRGTTPFENRIFGKPGLSDLYVEGSLIQGTEGYSGFSSTNYLNMANVIKKGEFLDQYQIHQIYWIYLDQRRDSYLLSSEFGMGSGLEPNGFFFYSSLANTKFWIKTYIDSVTTEYDTECIAHLWRWLYVEFKISGDNMNLSPNDIEFSVHYSNGDTCSKSLLNIGSDLIGSLGGEAITDFRVGYVDGGSVAGIESWRGWRNWTHTVTKNCHAACMPNWCLEDGDPNACFPSAIYVFKERSTQVANKFTIYFARQLAASTLVNTCSDILTDDLYLGTDSVCSYDQPTITLTVYVGNGHAVTSASKICIDPTKAAPAGVLVVIDLNCLEVSTDLPTVTITAPIEAAQYSYTDPITVASSTANVASYTIHFETLSGPTSYVFSGANETSKIIPANSLVPGTYVFKVYLDITDSEAFAPNDTVTVEILTNLTSSSQLGDRFYFTFDHSLPTPVSDCSLVNVGLGLLGTTPICTSTTNVLTIQSNLTDSTYVNSNSIGISNILTAHAETLTVDHAPPSLAGSTTPSSAEWDAGVDGNKWEVALTDCSDLTLDEWTWTKVSGPALTFLPNQSAQSYLAEALALGESYVVSATANFTNAPWLSITHQFTAQKMNFGVVSNTQSESKLTIVLSDSRVVINSCTDIFEATTVGKLGDTASCTYNTGTKTVTVYASGDHTLGLNSNLVYSNSDLSSTPNFVLGAELPSASISVNGGAWTLDSSLQYVLTINTADMGSITAPQITYQFIYVSGPFVSYIFPNIVDNVSTIPALTLPLGDYQMKIAIVIADYNDYTYYHSQSFIAKVTKTEFANHGPKFNITLNMDWPSTITSCSEFFEASSLTLLTADARCVRDNEKKKCLYVYAGNTSVIAVGDTLALKILYYINNTMTATQSMPVFSSITLSDPTKHWSRDQVQTVSAVLANFALGDYFTISYKYELRGSSEKNITGDSASSLGTFLPLRIDSAGEHSLLGVAALVDGWGQVTYYHVVTGILAALPPYPSATGVNASYPQAMGINLTSHSTLDMDTGTKSENLTYAWSIFTDDLLTVPYSPWTIQTTENLSIAADYFPIGIYYAKLTVTKWAYFTSWTKGVLNISSSNTKLEISSPNLANFRADVGTTFKAATISLNGSTDFSIHWEISPDIYNRYQGGGFLTVPANTFIPGGLYVLGCKILGDNGRRVLEGGSTEVVISIKAAKTINVGALLITPMTGDGLTTEFNIDANTWSDPTGQALKYRFAYQIVGTTSENWFRGWDHSNTVPAIKIPQGKDVFYNTVEIKVQAKNVDNSTAVMCKNITVKPIVIADKSAFVDNYLGTAVTTEEKLAAVASTTFLLEEDVKYAEPDSCGGCDPDHGTCNSENQLCVCEEGYKLSSLCNIADTKNKEIVKVALTLTIVLIENSEAALKNPEEASQMFNMASNILSNQVPMPLVATKIENYTYYFLDLALSNDTSDEEEKTELTPDLSRSLMLTLGKIGGSLFIQRDNDLQNAGDPSKQSGQSDEELEERSEKYVDNVERLSNKSLSNILPGTELENVDTGSFSLSGGRFTLGGISKKDLDIKGGSKLSMPVWKFDKENTLVKYKLLDFKKNPRMNMTNATIGNSQRFSISSDDDKIMEISNLLDPLKLQYTFTGLSNDSIEILKCSFYNSTLGKYSVAGVTTLSKTIFENGNVVILCQSNHLSEFAVATDPAMDTSGDTQAIIENSNLETVGDMDKIDEVNATSKSLWLVGIISFIMLLLIITFGIYDYRKEKKKATAEREMEEGNKLGRLDSIAKVVPLEDQPMNECPSICEKIVMERENINNPSSIQLKRANSWGLLESEMDSPRPKFRKTLSNTMHILINSPTDDQGHISRVSTSKESVFPILQSDANTQTKVTLETKKKEEIRTKGCWATTMITVAECHGITKPFIEEDGGMPRRDKFLLLYLEIILYIWVSAIFFDLSGGEEVENQMTAMGLIVLAIAVILLTMPPVLMVIKLLTRPGIPAKFLNQEGELLINLEDKLNQWRRCQCYWTILGYVLAWILIIFFTCHILVMTIVMGDSITDLWLTALLITSIIDYIFLQTLKGFILMCCLSEDCVDFMITFFAGNIA